MALNLPPIPNGPISETPIWRSWFTRLQSVLTTTTPGSVPVNHNALSSIQGGSALERYHLAASDVSKLAGIEAGAQVNNISNINATDLTDGGDTTLHYHSTDRDLANATGQLGIDHLSTIQAFSAAQG